MPIAERQEEKTMDDEKALWKKCVEFHGHECGGPSEE